MCRPCGQPTPGSSQGQRLPLVTRVYCRAGAWRRKGGGSSAGRRSASADSAARKYRAAAMPGGTTWRWAGSLRALHSANPWGQYRKRTRGCKLTAPAGSGENIAPPGRGKAAKQSNQAFQAQKPPRASLSRPLSSKRRPAIAFAASHLLTL